MACIVKAHIVMACMVMACTLMASFAWGAVHRHACGRLCRHVHKNANEDATTFGYRMDMLDGGDWRNSDDGNILVMATY